MSLSKNVIIAIDSFKDSLKSNEANEIVYNSLNNLYPNNNYIKISISDGGEGLVESITNDIKYYDVRGPSGSVVKGFVGFIEGGKTAIIEMSSASGIEHLEKEKRNANCTTSYGTGELILNALDRGVNKIIIGLGGSATNDLGIGMLKALGFTFYNKNNQSIGMFGKDIFDITTYNDDLVDPRLKYIDIIIATDVENILLGEEGSSQIYGIQKGLSKEETMKYDDEFKKLVELFDNKEASLIPGSGAAGGMGYSLIHFLNAKVEKGFKCLIEATKMEEKIKNFDILITGEGKIDNQTKYGKAPYEMAKIFKKNNPKGKVYALCGILGDISELNLFDEFLPINPENETIETSIKNAKHNLKNTIIKSSNLIME